MRILPNWLVSYMNYAKPQESPDIFHFWCGISAIATALGRSVYIDRGAYSLRPAMYILLMAGSAWCRKGIALDLAEKIIRNAGIAVFSDKMTAQAIVTRLQLETIRSGNAECTMLASELASFMTREDAVGGTITLLTRLFDSPDHWEYATKGGGIESLDNVCLNILAASTPRWAVRCIPEDAAGGGFWSRVLIVSSNDYAKVNAKPILDKNMQLSLTHDLIQIRKISGEIKLSDKAEENFNIWYTKIKNAGPRDEIEGMLGRAHDHVLKTALVLSISESDKLIITEDHLFAAIMAVESLLSQIKPRELGSIESQRTERIRSQIENKKEVSHASLLRNNSHAMTTAEFRDAVETLTETREIEIALVGTRTVYRWLG